MRPCSLVLALLVLPAAQESDAAALLADDLVFAENLALQRFFDLSTGVIGEVKEGLGKLPGDHVEQEGDASLVEARVLRRRGEIRTDPDARLADFSAAIDRLQDWTRAGSPFAYLDRMVDAWEDLAALLRLRGMLQVRRFQEGDAAAQKAAEEDFRAAEKAFDQVQVEAEGRAKQLDEMELPDQAQAMRARAFNSLYQRGLNSIEWSAVAADPIFRLERAIAQLDDFTWEVSPDLLVYYQALYEQARAEHKLGRAGDARGLLQSILDKSAHAWASLDDYPPALVHGVLSLFDSTWGYLARIEADQGDLAAAQHWIERLLQQHDQANQPLSQDGMIVLLDWARRLAALGRGSEATDLAKRVVDAGRGYPEGEEAAGLLATLVSSSAGGDHSVGVLMDVARGHAGKSEWADAAHAYLRAGGAATSADERRAHAFDAWSGAGSSLQRLGRHLEAALAYEEAVAVAQALALGTDKIEQAAVRMYASYNDRFVETQLPFDKQLRDDASARLLAIPDLDLDLAFHKASEGFGELKADDVAGHLAVKADLESVPPTSPNSERAQVLAARCLVGAGRKLEALLAFESLERRFADPALEPTNANARNRREIAEAQCRYYHASLLLEPGVARPDEALAVLKNFEADVAGQTDFHDLAKLLRVDAHVQAGDVAGAEAALAALQEAAGKPANLARGAFRVAQALEASSRRARDEGRLAPARDLLLRAAHAMWLYAQNDGFSSFMNLAAAGDWYLEAGQPADGLKVFEKVLEVFGRGASAEQLDRARIGQAQALDGLRDFGRSRSLWLDLVERNPTNTRVRRGAARSFGGWMELDAEGNVLEVPGSGDYEKASGLWGELIKATDSSAKYGELWWEAKLGAIHTLAQQGGSNPERLRLARTAVDQLKIFYPNFDEDTLPELPPESRYPQPFKPFFRHLDRKLVAR